VPAADSGASGPRRLWFHAIEIRYLRLFLLLVTLLATLLSNGCRIISASFFPDYLSLVVESIDLDSGGLKGLISDPEETETDLSVLNNGFTGDLLFLVVRKPGEPEQLVVFATDPLTPLTEPPTTRGKLEAAAGLLPGEGQFGRLRMVDADGNYVIGNFVFPSSFSPVLEIYNRLNLSPFNSDDVGFAIKPGNPAGWDAGNYVLRSNPNMGDWYLDLAYFTPGVTGFTTWDGAIDDQMVNAHKLTTASTSDLRVEGAYYSAEADAVFLAMRRFKQIRVVFLESGVAPPPPPGDHFFTAPFLSDILDYPYFEIDNVAEGAFHLTADGVVIRTEDGVWERYRDQTGLTDSLRAPHDTGWFDDAFSPGGDYYYLVDEQARRLYKMRTWW
jgi:hypothetical protein